MSEFGDNFFRRLQRINAGLEPATQPGRRCARCQKDMRDYLLLFEPTSTDVCNECKEAIRKEEYIARWKAAKPPVYDIDEIISAPNRKPWDVVRELNSKIDPCCPESVLLEPELAVRDFEEFSCFTGDDFGYILSLNSGPYVFLHGLRAMQAIGAKHLAESMVRIREFCASRGIVFPDPLPDPWLCDDIKIDSDLERELVRLTDQLKPYDGLKGGDLQELLVDYLRARVETLRERKAKR